jgi:hypothetical protein
MELRKILLGRDDFKSRDEIVDVLRNSGTATGDDLASAETLLIFQTSSQQTWLVATNRALYCVLDDLNKNSTNVQWAVSSADLHRVGDHLAEVSALDKNDRVGLLNVGKHTNWLYSKKLFANDNVVNRLSRMVLDKMNFGAHASVPENI